MNRPFVDVMTVSLTINCCILLVILIPRLREKILATPTLKRYKSLINMCRHYAEKPMELANITTSQLILWPLVISSLVAICASDVIRYPFHSEISQGWQTIFIETLFAINIGRYVFIIVEKLLSKPTQRKAKSRADTVHHFVTVLCYVLILAYGENLLLGLVGILIESTSVIDVVGRYCKERDLRHTKFYRRLVVFNCVGTICFRGVIPTVFLVIAMFQQSPFTMAYVSLSVFFFSIIFFSVVNVWQILLSLQRLFNQLSDKSSSLDSALTEMEIVRPQFSTLVRHNSRGALRLKIAKNNLGYIKPYDNKNIASCTDEKHNMNNRKEFAKDTLELHVSPELFLKTRSMRCTKISSNPVILPNLQRRHSLEETELRDSFVVDGLGRRPTVLFLSGRRQMRDSNSTSSSNNSDTVLIAHSNRSSHSNGNCSNLNNSRGNSDEIRYSVLANRFNNIRSSSMGDIVVTCNSPEGNTSV